MKRMAQRRIQQGYVSHHSRAKGVRFTGRIIPAMNSAAVAAEVERILREQKPLPDQLDPNAPLTDYGLDSLDAINVLFALEEQFEISIPDEKARSIRTMGEMIAAIEELNGGR